MAASLGCMGLECGVLKWMYRNAPAVAELQGARKDGVQIEAERIKSRSSKCASVLSRKPAISKDNSSRRYEVAMAGDIIRSQSGRRGCR